MTITTAIAYLILIGGLAFIIAFLSLLLHIFDDLESNIPRQSFNNTNNTEYNHVHSDPIAAAIASYDENRDAHERQRSRQDTINIRVIAATGAFALIAALAAAVSSIISSGQLEQSRRSADISEQSAERQLRAYIGIIDVIIKCSLCDSFDAKGLPAKIPISQRLENVVTMTIQNGGITPAYNVIGIDTWMPMPFSKDLPKGFDYSIKEERDPDIPPGAGMLNPGEKGPSPGPLFVRDIPLIVRARKHEISLFYYGEIVYVDIFEKTRRTPFCYRYIPDFAEFPFVNCEEHNTPKKDE
jgi:hypothetical protein